MASRSETAKLLASLELKDKFSPAIRNADKALGKFDANLDRTSSRAHRAGQQIGTGIKNAGKLAAVGIGIVATNLALGLDSLIKVEKQTAQTEAVLKSTGGVAGLTAKDIRGLAEEYEALNATIGDETIQEAENLLLGFTNIRKEAFEPTLAAALDMNTRLGKGPEGLTQTIQTLGKALNDPTKGLGKLAKAGITFSDEQTKRIKKLQEEGRLYEAQTIILDELNKRFGGAFAAEGETTAGTVAKFTDAIEDTQRALAEGALPAVRNVADALTELVQDPEIQQGVRDLGESIGDVLSKENIKEGAAILGDVVKAVAKAAPTIASGLSTAATAIGAVIGAFQKLPPEVQQLAIGAFAVNKLTGGLITNIAGGVFGALKSMSVQAGVVNVTGATAGSMGGLGKGGGGGGFGNAVKIIGSVTIAAASIHALAEQFEIFQGQRDEAQGALGSQVDKTVGQDFKQTLANLNATTANLKNMSLPDQLIATTFGGEQITSNLNMAAQRLLDTENLTLSEMNAARDSLDSASDLVRGVLDTTKVDAAISELDRRIQANVLETQRQGERQTTATDRTKEVVSQKVAETTRETTRGAQQIQASQNSAAAVIAASQAVAAGSIISAIYAARPVISVQNVTRTYNRTTNYGPTTSSKNKNAADSNYGPN